MFSSVSNCRRTLAAQTSKVSRARAGDDEIGLLRHAILEYSGAVEHEAARFPGDLPDDPLQADERGQPSLRYIIKYSTCPWPVISPVNVLVTTVRFDDTSRRARDIARGRRALVGLTVNVFESYDSVSMLAKNTPDPGAQYCPLTSASDDWSKHSGM